MTDHIDSNGLLLQDPDGLKYFLPDAVIRQHQIDDATYEQIEATQRQHHEAEGQQGCSDTGCDCNDG